MICRWINIYFKKPHCKYACWSYYEKMLAVRFAAIHRSASLSGREEKLIA